MRVKRKMLALILSLVIFIGFTIIFPLWFMVANGSPSTSASYIAVLPPQQQNMTNSTTPTPTDYCFEGFKVIIPNYTEYCEQENKQSGGNISPSFGKNEMVYHNLYLDNKIDDIISMLVRENPKNVNQNMERLILLMEERYDCGPNTERIMEDHCEVTVSRGGDGLEIGITFPLAETYGELIEEEEVAEPEEREERDNNNDNDSNDNNESDPAPPEPAPPIPAELPEFGEEGEE